MADKNYIRGFYKEINTQWWPIFNLNINVEDLQKLPVDDFGNVRTTLIKRREVGQFWDTHALIENNYVPAETNHSK